MDRSDLLARLRQGDEEAVRQVVADEFDGLYAVALGVLGREADAEDACQEVLLKLLRFAPKLAPDTSLRAWLRKVCLNHCLDQRRARVRARQVDLTERLPMSPSSGPEQSAEEAELREAVKIALGDLSDMQRAAFVLRHFEGCSVREVAKALGCAEGTAKAHLSRAVSKLRVRLGTLRPESGGAAA